MLRLQTLFITASFAAVPLAAQATEVVPGSRIRFTGSEVGSTITSTVLERHGDTVRVAPLQGQPFDVRLSKLSRIQISQGKSHMAGAWVGAAWGAGLYAATAALLLSADCEGCSGDADPTDAIPLVLSGAGTGALIGMMIGRETWEDVRVVVKSSNTLFGRRLAVGFRARF